MAPLSGDRAAVPPASLSDDELLHRVSTLAARSRAAEVDLLRHLAEVDARGLYAREACPSMFVYCTRVLRFSEAEAYMRITAARVGREHASLLAALADGRLHLSALVRLAPHVTGDNVESLVARAAGRSKREVMELVAELAPRPDVATTIRALPDTAVGAVPRREPVAPTAGASLSSSLVAGRPFAELPRPPVDRIPRRRRPLHSAHRYSVRTEYRRLLSRSRLARFGPPSLPPPTSSRSPPAAIASSSRRTVHCGTSSSACATSSAWPSGSWLT